MGEAHKGKFYFFSFINNIMNSNMLLVCFSQHRGTVTQTPGFNPEDDAQKLRKAMKGIGEFFKVVHFT